MAECGCFLASPAGWELAYATVWQCRTQHRSGAGLCELGHRHVEEFPADGIQRPAIPSGDIQRFEPHQLPHTQQRHQLVDFQSNFESGAAAVGTIRAEILVLSENYVS